MKKRFSTILLAVMMLLSFCSFTAYADETALELTHYDIITNNIRLEFSSEVSNVTATLKSTDNNAIEVTPTASSDSKIWDLKLSEKMDITKQYVLNFSADTLTATKVIKFTVYANENFENCTESLTELDDIFAVKPQAYAGSQTTISESHTNGKINLKTSEDGNNKYLEVKLSDNTSFFMKNWEYNHKNKYYNFEADIMPLSDSANTFGLACTDYSLDNGNVNLNFYKCGTNDTRYQVANKTKLFADVDKFSDFYPNVSAYLNNFKTVQASLSKNVSTSNDVFNLYNDGTNILSQSGTINNLHNRNAFDGAPDNFFYILKTTGSGFGLDNYKLYAYTMEDYKEIALEYIDVTTKVVSVVYSDDITSTPTVSLIDGTGADLSVNSVTKSGKKLIIKPTTQLDLEQQYLLKVSGVSNGSTNAKDISKLVSFDVYANEDFENCTESLTELDDVLAIRPVGYAGSQTKISESTSEISLQTETNGENEVVNKYLKVKLTNDHSLFVKDWEYNHKHKYYNFEADIKPVSASGQHVVSILCTDYSQGATNANIHFYKYDHAAYQVMNPLALFKGVEKSSNFDIGGIGVTTFDTVGASLSKENVSGKDVFTLYYNGNNKFSQSGTINNLYNRNAFTGAPDNFFYLLKSPYGSTFCLDNYKLYAPILTDAQTLPGFEISDTFITSRYIKITFNTNIDDKTLDKISVTSLGSDLSVTKTVDGKILTIAPTSGEFPFDKEITYIVDGVKNTNGTVSTYMKKSFSLKKLWYDTFDNANDITDLYGKYHYAIGQNASGNYSDASKNPTYTLEEYVAENPNVFSIETQDNGNKRLVMNETKNGVFTHREDYAGFTAGRKIWKDIIIEYDIDTTAEKVGNFYYNYNMLYGSSVGGGSHLCDQNNRMTFDSHNKKAFSVMTVRNSTDKTADIYIDDKFNKQVGYDGSEGEFGFRNASSTDKIYIDNIKVYKVVDFTADEYVWLTNTTVKTETVGETEKTKVSGTINLISYSDDKAISAGNAIVVAYNEDGKILGINTVATESVSAKGQKTFTYTIDCSEKDVERVAVFVWDSLSGMKPVIQNRSTTDITIVK